MTNPPNIDAIIAELSEATGASRRMDKAIHFLRDPAHVVFMDAEYRRLEVELREKGMWEARGAGLADHVNASPRYTASLDAAMTLVPERWLLRQLHFNSPCADDRKWNVQLHGGREGEDCFTAFAATRVLALCAAALRSRGALRVRSALIGEVGRDG